MIDFYHKARKHCKHSWLTSSEIFFLCPGTRQSRQSFLKREVQNERLSRIRRGLYLVGPDYRHGPIDVFNLAQYIYGPSYISMESALSYHGWIPEAVYVTTSCTPNRAKKFTTPVGDFTFDKVPVEFAFSLVSPVHSGDFTFLVADPLRALADLIYVRRKKWSGCADLFNDLRIDSENLVDLPDPKRTIEELLSIYKSRRIIEFVEMLTKEGLVEY